LILIPGLWVVGELPLPAIIDWLVHERFGGYDVETKLAGAMTTVPPAYAADATAYRELLHTFPEDRLRRLFCEKVQELVPVARAAIESRERFLFFNRPIAQADYVYWARMPIWTVEEAVALSLGKDPRIVNWATFQSERLMATPYAFRFAGIAGLIQRSVDAGVLDYPLEPKLYLEWCDSIEFHTPEALAEELTKVNGALVNWQAAYFRLREMHEQMRAGYRDIAQAHATEIAAHKETSARLNRTEAFAARVLEHANAERVEQRAEVEALKAEILEAEAADFDPREKETALRMIAGMIAGKYGYNPSARRSDTVQKIMTDLNLCGLNLSDETIRKFVKRAAAYLSPEAKEGVG
jgi:hypothetical protein